MKIVEVYKRLKNLYEVKDVEDIYLAGKQMTHCHLEPIDSDLLELILTMLNRFIARPVRDGKCPRCGNAIKNEDSKYCDMCAQKIYWSNDHGE